MTTNLPRRLLNLHLGLALFGVSVAIMIRANLGVDSWDVLHQGLSERLGLPFGWVVNGVGVLVLLAWLPLRQRPGIGTIANVVLVGLVADAALAVIPAPHWWPARAAMLATAILLNAIATGLYVGAGLGPGPRDGLMTGLAARGHSIRLMRTLIELSVLSVGWLLGGTVGIGTLLFAITIGPLVQYFMPKLATTHHRAGGSREDPRACQRRAERGSAMLRLNVIVASTRPGRVGRHIADWFTEVAIQHNGFDVHMADLAEVNLPFHDEPNQPVDGGPYLHEHTLRWSAMTAAADAFVLVMPEYNRGYSAPLKNAIDYLYLEWLYKPVGFVSYGMASAGLRAVEMIKPVLTTLKMMPVPEAVSIHLRQALDADGHLVPTPAMATTSKTMLDELHLLAGALAPIRKLA